MCGIAGWLSPAGAVDQNILTAMNQKIAHRGPDADAVWANDARTVGFTHRRLAIIDLQAASNQPLHDATGKYTLIFNGEIYNFKALRAELESLGHTFRTKGDGEVLLEAYKQWGVECLRRLDGMFAFALWDEKQQWLFMARDRYGKKPFFYSLLPDSAGGGLLFASEPQAFNAHPAFKSSLNTNALCAYLTLGYSVGATTLHDTVKRLPAAHAMLLPLGSAPKIYEYWDLSAAYRAKQHFDTPDDAADRLRDMIDDATRARLESDVPFGLFLSGGMDSNSVLASMVREQGAANTHTFSIGFDEKSYDESGIAEQSARHFGTQHTTIRVDPTTIDIEKILRHAGQEPLADTSFIPSYVLAQHTAQHVKMVLTGDGGDEVFAGYPTYIANFMRRATSPFLPNIAWQKINERIQRLPTGFERMGLNFKLKQMLRGMTLDARRAHFSWRVIQNESEWQNLLNPELAAGYSWDGVFSEFDAHFQRVHDLHPLDQALYVDAKTWMVDSVLVKMDRATMAHGLEARSPLLDHHIAEFAAGLAPNLKLRLTPKGFKTKWILRHSQRDRLPDFIHNQPKKGFSVPIASWFSGRLSQLMKDTINDPLVTPYLNKPAVDAMMDEHIAQRTNHSLTLFNLMVFAQWMHNNR